MSKYVKLTKYLESLSASRWDATFAQIEGVLKFKLPDSAREHSAWWSNQGRAQSLAWENAGWKTSGVNPEKRRVSFVRTGSASKALKSLSIADAKEGLAKTFGIPIENIEINIRG